MFPRDAAFGIGAMMFGHWFPPLAFCPDRGPFFAGVKATYDCAFDCLGATTGNKVSINNLFILYQDCVDMTCVYVCIIDLCSFVNHLTYVQTNLGVNPEGSGVGGGGSIM